MTHAQRTRMYEQIKRHGEQLQAIFPAARDMDPIKLCKKLRRLESKAHRLAEDLCNVPIPEVEFAERKAKIYKALNKILGLSDTSVHVLLKFDPRGYALKIDSQCIRIFGLELYRDLGGYGIIAPEFDGT